MALSIATGLSHLHIEIIGTQVSLLFFCKKIIPDPNPGFFGESRSGYRPRRDHRHPGQPEPGFLVNPDRD